VANGGTGVTTSTGTGSVVLSNSPALTTPALGTPSALIATNASGTANNLNAGIGVNQTWQNVTASRSLATTYTNDTNKPILLILSTLAGTGGTVIGLSASVNGGSAIRFMYSQVNSGNQTGSGTFLVPSGATYNITRTGTPTIEQWWELR
jgi:hypothetical protein